MMLRGRAILAAIALVLGLIGCGDSRPATDAAVHPDSLVIVLDSVPVPEPTADESAVLALEGEGLRVFNASSGSARPVSFGTPSTETVEIVKTVTGIAPREQGENATCGGTYATWENGLSLWFTQDRFVGWAVRAGNDTLTTASGVGIGSTRTELESVYDAQVARTSLGDEFTAGNLAGVLDSSGPGGRIIAMWAGVTCLAR